jgi:hypothetical protein
VLTLRLPKPEARKPRRVEITSTTAQPAIEGTESMEGAESGSERELVGSAS